MSEMLSKKPYIIRAFYQWIVESDCTPYLMLNTKSKRVEIPRDYVQDNKIVLNIAPTSANKLEIHNDYIFFYAKFNGVEERIHTPIEAVLAIYAAENGDGFMFEEEPIPEEPIEKTETKDNTSFLKLVDD